MCECVELLRRAVELIEPKDRNLLDDLLPVSIVIRDATTDPVRSAPKICEEAGTLAVQIQREGGDASGASLAGRWTISTADIEHLGLTRTPRLDVSHSAFNNLVEKNPQDLFAQGLLLFENSDRTFPLWNLLINRISRAGLQK